MDSNEILDVDIEHSGSSHEQVFLISANKFAILSFVSFGIYTIWWMYTTWKFYNEKDNMNIHPALRAIFSIFFIYSLMEKIQEHALHEDIKDSFSSGLLFVFYLILSFLGNLPDPFWLISLLIFLPVLPAFNLFNKILLKSSEINATERVGFDGPQWAVLIIGILWVVLVLLGLIASDEDMYY